jgi:anti-sigma factor RsiW
MNHDEIRAKLSEFRDGEITRDEQSEILRHLAGCPPCVQELNDLEKLSRAFFSAPLPPSEDDTEDFVVSVMARLPAPAVEVPVELLPLRVWAPAAAFAFAALALSLWLPREDAADPLGTQLAAASQYAPDNLVAYAEGR